MKAVRYFSAFLVLTICIFVALNSAPVNGKAYSEEIPSPIQTMWASISDQHKSTFNLYDDEGELCFQVQMVLANEKSLGNIRTNLLKFMLGDLAEWQPGPNSWKQVFLVYLTRPPGSIGGWFDPQKLVIDVPTLNEEWTFAAYQIQGPIEERGGHPHNYSMIQVSDTPITGLFLIPTELARMLTRVQQQSRHAYLYYKGHYHCGPRSRLHLPGEIY